MNLLMIMVPTLLLLALPFLATAALAAARVGLNFGRLGSNLPPPDEVVTLVRSLNVTSVRIYDADADVLTAFASTQIGLAISIPNEDVPRHAELPFFSREWIRTSVKGFYPATNITTILVGNEVLTSTSIDVAVLLAAMKNIYVALGELKKHIKVTTPHSLDVLQTALPPSSASFRQELRVWLLLNFLAATEAPLMINIYTYPAYQRDKGANFPLEFALMEPTGFSIGDPLSGLEYDDLFSAYLDAIYFAIAAAGFSEMQVVVLETGWPYSGMAPGPSRHNARTYNQNLVTRCLSGRGPPANSGKPLNAFIYNLFDEDLAQQNASYGLFFPNKTMVYELQMGGDNEQRPLTRRWL